ncbi:MAG: sialidase family protein [Armatimonadota bacterium]
MRAQVIERTVFHPSPTAGTAVLAATFYTQPEGRRLVGIHTLMTRSDTGDVAYRRLSEDNGATWSAPAEMVMGERRPTGILRRHQRAAIVDPHTGRFLSFRTEGILPTDHPLEGMRQWRLYYSVSADGGLTETIDEQIRMSGDAFSADDPLPGVRRGKSSIMLGDLTCVPLVLADGTVLLPCQITPVDGNGEYANPGVGFTYHHAVVLRGRWQADGRLAWELSAQVAADPARTTRGLFEPTLAQLADDRLLMVMRGSNDGNGYLPGYRWYALSTDQGRTWSAPAPWTYEDGTPFYSPSSCSQLLAHSGGTLRWLGNIAPDNPSGNSPRYPFVVAEVDSASGLLKRDTVCAIDDRGADECAALTLSNFFAREDRETGHLLVHLTRLFSQRPDDWTADALLYRIALTT